MSVAGIGGLFFRSKDPEGRATWYREYLGIDAGQDRTWEQASGLTVFAPFPERTDYFPPAQAFMLNLRVTSLEPIVARLNKAGIPVERHPEWDGAGFGKFARIHDPEGLQIELWEPDTAT